MNAVARMVVLDLRTVAPYRNQALILAAVVIAVLAGNKPVVLLPAIVLLLTSQLAAYPFVVGDKAGLQTLYAVLPLPRRAVLLGHYAWALSTFVVSAAVGTALTLILARTQSARFDGGTFAAVLTLSWAVFVVNVAVQFPLFIRFGYSRIGLLVTYLPLALVMIAVTRLHLSIVSFATIERWLPLFWVAGAALLAASVAVSLAPSWIRPRPELPGE